MKSKSSRERCLCAARGEPVDRVPVMYWLNPHMACRLISDYRPGSSLINNMIGKTLWKRFVKRGRLEAGEWARALPLLMEDYGNQQYALDLGADIAITAGDLTSPSTFVKSIKKQNGKLTFRGNFDILYGLCGIYFEPLKPLVDRASELRHVSMLPLKREYFDSIRKFREKHPDKCLLVEVTSFNQFLMGFIMQMDRYMLSLYDDRESIRIFLERLADWVIEIIRYSIEAGADIVYLQDDYGMNDRPLISPKLWKELIFPQLRRMIDVSHQYGTPFMLHSCGYQMPFLDDYVEAGLDILQSFQPKAGNELKAALAKYGDRLTFATGIDIQRGESMSPKELKEEIIHNYQIGRETGRFILATTHMMQCTMPMENVRTIFNTVEEIQAGRHG